MDIQKKEDFEREIVKAKINIDNTSYKDRKTLKTWKKEEKSVIVAR